MTSFWIGGYTESMGGTATGIGRATSRPDGTLEFIETVVETSSPSFLATSATSFLATSATGVLYATDEAGRIEAFRQRGGELTLEPLGGQPTSGAFPCHVSLTHDELFVSNYGGGSVDVFPLLPDGSIGALAQTLNGDGSGPNPAQDAPHAHATLVDGESVLAADLGADVIRSFRLGGGMLESTGSTSLPPGTGPRDLLKIGQSTIVLGELSGALFTLDTDGAVVAQGSLVTDWQDGDHAAALAVDESATWLYSGLRGSNRIAIVRLDELQPMGSVVLPAGIDGGDWPRHLLVSGRVLHVACQLTDSIASYSIDPASGALTLLGTPEPVASPTFIVPVM